jgi:hypothetical protein
MLKKVALGIAAAITPTVANYAPCIEQPNAETCPDDLRSSPTGISHTQNV